MATWPPGARPLIAALMDAQTRFQLFPAATSAGTTVLVGVSGGGDSVCLLHALHQVADLWQLHLHVAHLDHSLRPDSAEDAAFVAGLADQLGLPCHSRRLSPQELTHRPEGPEAAARRLRYRFLGEVARAITPPGQPPVVAVAHHQDDQAETLLMNLLRGSGLAGLGAMAWVGPLPDDSPTNPSRSPVYLVRPLLGVRRAAIRAYLEAFGLPWREDPSNHDLSFLRNRIRHQLLPELATINPRVVETLARTADLLAQEARRAERWDRKALDQLTLERTPAERVVLDLTGLLAQDPATQRGVLRQALAEMQADLRAVGFHHIDNILARLEQSTHAGGPYPLLDHLVWTVAGATDRTPARLSLHRDDELPFAPQHPFLGTGWRQTVGEAPIPCPGQLQAGRHWQLLCRCYPIQHLPPDWRTPGEPWRAFLDADRVHTLALTTPWPGARFAPLGMGGRHKSLGDFFTDRKVPAALRAGWPVVIERAERRPVWICGQAISHQVRITDQTRQVLQLQWQRLP
ncbi:tRNA lysidine(34) synthetase TilS [Litorilinea aerophila]|uniref:tRNA(Ile)-lysidine synthase n=1 Tax=Litorilinea aerophila TaxID=1204385 RepID=A0A540VAK5_9CHLR|nr:tRNA lysidine(34) synthetase TilS [Litorilinea aerophila]MCC9078303.1 tRNA lysidine(34) synthetase TilS [Litorilinea aerophila]